MAKDLVSIAIGELGYTAGKNNYTKYGAWIGQPNCQWCQAFVTWCCYHAGLGNQVAKTAYTPDGMNYFKKQGRFKTANQYTPKRGDIVYMLSPESNSGYHVGIVESVDTYMLHTIEGNYSNKVTRVNRVLGDVVGYGVFTETLPVLTTIQKPQNVKATSKKNNQITVTFTDNSSTAVINTFNIYIDGVIKAYGVHPGSYTYDGISAGNHTVGVERSTPFGLSPRVTVRVTVEGKKISKPASSTSASASTQGTNKKTSKKGSSSQSGKEELKYLKQFLKTIEKKNAEAKKQPSLNYEISKINYHHEVKINLTVQNGKKLFSPPVIEGLKVVWERKNTAGKLSFQTILSSKYKIKEGNSVLMTLNGKKFFYGFVFTVKHGKDKKLDVTVYDQLRYLKNKDTYVYKKKTTDALIRMIAKDMGLNVGTLAKTKCAVTRAEDNLTLFDIISNSLNETLMATGNTYTLYDDCGKLMLKKPTGMKVTSCLIDAETAEDYSYSRSIDQDVYNQIKLEYQSDDGKKVKFYYTRSKKNISKWGTLQYFEKIDYPKLAKIKGEVLLKLYNRVSKTINISGAFGNAKVRAGSLIPVLLNLGDDKVSSFLLVDKVTHMFDNGVHKMDLDLSGGGFDSSQ